MTKDASDKTALSEAGQQLGRLRSTEAGRKILSKAAVRFLEKHCKKCKRSPTKYGVAELLETTPPSDVFMEKRLIGMLLLDRRTLEVVSPVLSSKHFHNEHNAACYERLTEAQRAKCPADMDLFLTWLREHYGRNELERLGGPAYLVEAMADTFAHPDYARHYAKVIRNHAVRRDLIRAATQIVVDSYAADMPLKDLIDRSRATLEGVVE